MGVQSPVRREEDLRLLWGKGRYVDDVREPNQAHGYVLRSPHAHARGDPVAKPAALTRAESRVLDLRRRMRERDRLSAGGRWIRTSGSGASGEADAILPVKDRPR